MTFENIKNIDVLNLSSWEDKIFLTFDIDWCSDEVLSYILDIIGKYDIKVTFFVTHESPFLKKMRDNPNIELGIHPNFNPLLNGDFRYGKNIDDVIKYYKKIVPEAVSVRSHSLTVSSPILNASEKYGLKYECNQYIPYNSNIEVNPYKYINSIIRVPHFWEDDLHCLYQDCWDIDIYLKYEGIKVFDFHPNNLFLNCYTSKDYDNAKPYFHDYQKLKKFQNTNYGEMNFFNELVERVLNGSV